MADSNKIGKYELTALIVGATIGSESLASTVIWPTRRHRDR